MKIYKVWIQIEEADESEDHYLNISEPYEAGKFDSEAKAVKFIENELMTTRITGSAVNLLEACKVLTSYTSELLYKLDNQVNLNDIEAIRQAKDAITRYHPVNTPYTKLRNACLQVLNMLDVGGEQSRAFAEEIQTLGDALNAAPKVKTECPRCGAGSDEREFMHKDLIGTEAIHMCYICKKCGGKITEEFILTGVCVGSGQ